MGAKRELKEAVAEFDDIQIKEELLKNNCDWITFKMNVPAASHMGGIWERIQENNGEESSTCLMSSGAAGGRSSF